jgi:hypothetical protein
MDENNLFLANDEINFLERFSTPSEEGIFEFNNNNLTGYNIAKERAFKLAVLDWLNDGKPKLFRSPTEGNYLVRLMNVSLSPNDTLGRLLHTFSATAYEIEEINYDTLLNYGMIGKY